jgi:hypothetical protein
VNLWTLFIFSSDRGAQRSWRALFVRMVIGLVLFLIANLVTYWTSDYFEKLREYHQRVEGVFKRPGVRVLIVGDSHFAVPLNKYLNGLRDGVAYSVAFGGDGLRECCGKIHYILDRCLSIDTVILSAEPHMFSRGRLESSNRSFADLYFLAEADEAGLKMGWLSTLMNQVPLFNDDFAQYLRKVSAKRLAAAISKIQPRPACAAKFKSSVGQSWQQLSVAERKAKARATGLMDHKGVGEYPEPFTWYRKILEIARSHHVRVIGVRFPVDRCYASQVPAERIAIIDGFLRRNGIYRILDLRYLFTNPAYFDDADHVNARYADTLVAVLEKRLGVQLRGQPQISAPAD